MGLKFVGLHAHTDASVGDGIGKPEDHFEFVIKNAGEESMALACTDHGNANSFGYVLQAKQKYKKKGIPFKPIYGCELYIHPDLDAWQKIKDASAEETIENDLVVEVESESKSKEKWYNPIKRRHHMVILVQNKVGFRNLCKIITDSYRRGYYYFPRTDFKTLEKYNEGLIISTACLAGLPSWLIFRDLDKGDGEVFRGLDNELKPLIDIFGKDRANLEIQFNKLPEQRVVNKFILEYAQARGLNVIATGDSHYFDPKVWREREMYRLLSQQSKGFNVSDDDLPKSIDELKCELYPKNGDQMFDAYCSMYPDSDEEMDAQIIQAIERTYTIAHEQIEDIQLDTSMKLPKGFLKGKNADDELSELTSDALYNISNEWPEDKYDLYLERLKLELNVITKKGFALYFLTLKEALDKVKEQLLVGAGRGSGAGSLVCYLLGITQIDPIEHGLLFERFLSENRNEPPDIDNDIEDRDVAFDILKGHFGSDNVIAISNFNSLKLKSLVKDISKLYQIPFEEVNAVTSVMENESKQPLLDEVNGDQKLVVADFDGVYRHSPTFKAFIDKYPKVAESIKILFKQNRIISRHAGGVIITENPDEFMPIIRIRGVDQTPWGEGMTAKHLEPFGLIKYDFLGIATLRVIRRCIERILKKEGQEVNAANVNKFFRKHLSPDSVGQGDEEVFESIYHKGRFCGTFQFAEKNAQAFCQNALPKSIADISAITSIYRPGPLKGGVDKKYVHAVHNPEDVDFYHPVVKEVLGETFGFIVYQEQFMQLANKLAGFTLTESDELRKLLVRPVTSLGDEMKKKRIDVGQKFIDGCIANGIDPDRAETLWNDEILGFISYGFNKSHAVSYAYLSYQCAWLFHYHPDEWVCSYLENETDKEHAIYEVQQVGYKLGQLDIIQSGEEYTVGAGNVIHPPFSSVKGIGDAAIAELVEMRKSWEGNDHGLGNFISFFYDIVNIPQKNGKIKTKKSWKFSKFNKRALDALIRLEAMNGLGIFPDPFLNHKHLYSAFIENWDRRERQNFDIEEAITTASIEDFTNQERAQAQGDLLGTYDKTLLVSPEILDFFADQDILPLSDITTYAQPIWFILKKVEVKKTKTNKDYFKLWMMDITGKEATMNYFFSEPREGWEEKGIYVGELYMQEIYINNKRGTYIKRLV
jgi:DNA polymerase-3 subunit alpha